MVWPGRYQLSLILLKAYCVSDFPQTLNLFPLEKASGWAGGLSWPPAFFNHKQNPHIGLSTCWSFNQHIQLHTYNRNSNQHGELSCGYLTVAGENNGYKVSIYRSLNMLLTNTWNKKFANGLKTTNVTYTLSKKIKIKYFSKIIHSIFLQQKCTAQQINIKN